MFDVLHTVDGKTIAYIDHPNFRKLIVERYGDKAIVAPYTKQIGKSVREVGWNISVPYDDVKDLQKLAKEDQYKSEWDKELERRHEVEKEARKQAKQQAREDAKLMEKARKKLEREQAKEAKKAEKAAEKKANDKQLSLDI